MILCSILLYHQFLKGQLKLERHCLEAVGTCMRTNKLKSKSGEDRDPPDLGGHDANTSPTTCSGWSSIPSERGAWESSLIQSYPWIARGTFAQLQLVWQLRPYLSQLDLTVVVYALVKSCLGYCRGFQTGVS